MKTFREHLNEEIKIGALSCGGIDIERDAVRDEINGILAGIAAKPCVTPYASLEKVRKALAYFSIFLPKKVYLEGRHGIEVWEVSQFGDKMGVTDSGEWIHHVPAKYHLFFHYHRIGSMYYLEAKIVDEKELETRISTSEKMMAEEMDAAMRQNVAKAAAPKEKAHTALGDCDCSQGDSPSTKDAVKVSMKKIDEASTEKLIRYRNKAGEGREKGTKLAHAKLTGKAKVPATMPKHSYMEEDKDPCWKGYEMVGMKKKGGRKVPNCVPVKEEEQIDELKHATLKAYKSAAKDDRRVSKRIIKKGLDTNDRFKMIAKKRKKGLRMVADRLEETQIDELKRETVKRYENKAFKQLDSLISKAKDPYLTNLTPKERKTAEKRGVGLSMAANRLEEKLTKSMSASDVIHDFVHSKDPKFEGKSTKERQKMALGAYYGMHPEKSKK